MLIDKTQKYKDAERPVSGLLQYPGDREDGTVTIEWEDVVQAVVYDEKIIAKYTPNSK